jgi:GNAT superfamily N-acetyltransferase
METSEHIYSVSAENEKMDFAVIHQYLSQQAYWCRGIPPETLRQAMAGSLNVGVFAGDAQAGYARIVTDRATFAYLCDVFVLPAHRGRGLSKMLLAAIHAHADLQGLRRWVLFTKDAHTLYTQFGWQPIAEPGRAMEISFKNRYQQ